MPAPPAANIIVKLALNRRRMAQSMKRLLDIIAASDQKNYSRNPPRVFLPIFPTDDATLQAALQTVYDRLTIVINPTL